MTIRTRGGVPLIASNINKGEISTACYCNEQNQCTTCVNMITYAYATLGMASQIKRSKTTDRLNRVYTMQDSINS